MDESITISELATKIGAELGVSDWLALDRDRIHRFAEITEDTHEVHLNPVIARQWGFEDCFAHGFLTMSMLMRLQETALAPPSDINRILNYGFDRVRFLSPVIADRRIRGRFTLLALDEVRTHEWRRKLGVIIEIEGQGKPAMAAEWLALLSRA